MRHLQSLIKQVPGHLFGSDRSRLRLDPGPGRRRRGDRRDRHPRRGSGAAAGREARRRGHRGDHGAGPGHRGAAQGAGDGRGQGGAHQRRRPGRLRRAADLRRAGRRDQDRCRSTWSSPATSPPTAAPARSRRCWPNGSACRRSPRSAPWRSTAPPLRAERVRDGGYSEVTATLPAVVSVTEKINEPRYPNFKGIMAAKKKPVTTLGVADLGLDAGATGLANAATVVVDAAPRPPRTPARRSPTTAPAAPRPPSSWPPPG